MIVKIQLYAWLPLIFIILKLTGLVQWDWLWVFSPLWVPYCILIVLVWFLFSLLVIKIALEKVGLL